MGINTNLHLSDKASSVFFDKENTIWKSDPTVNTIQDIFDDIHYYNVNGYPLASESVYGLVLLSEEKDLENGGNDTVITTELLNKIKDRPYATYDEYGTVRLASTADLNKKEPNKIMTSELLRYSLDTKKASKEEYGSVVYATDQEVLGGIVEEKALSPNQLKMGISKIYTPFGISTETDLGTTRLTNINDLYIGKLHNGFSVTPRSFHGAKATTEKYGTIRYTKTSELNNTNIETAIEPSKIKTDVEKLTSNSIDIERLRNDLNDYVNGLDKLIIDRVDELWGDFDIGGYINEFISVGSFFYTYSTVSGGMFLPPDGRLLSRNDHAELFRIIGTRFNLGSDSDNTKFRMPDIRGHYLRMHGKSKFISGHPQGWYHYATGMYEFQDSKTGKHKHAGWAGAEEYKYGNGSTTSRTWYGSGRDDHDNATQYTNNGTNLGGANNLDPHNLIGYENRPWTMPMNIYMRVR